MKTKTSKRALPFKIPAAEVGIFGRAGAAAGILAIACGQTFGVPPQKIAAYLKSFRPDSSKRMEIIRKHWKSKSSIKKGEILIIHDAYNSNPDSVRLGLETLRDYPAKGKKIVVLGDMLELGKEARKEHRQVGLWLKEMGFKFLFGFGPETIHTLGTAAVGRGKTASFSRHYADKKSLASELGSVLDPGDVIYLKGSRGMKMEEVLTHLH